MRTALQRVRQITASSSILLEQISFRASGTLRAPPQACLSSPACGTQLWSHAQAQPQCQRGFAAEAASADDDAEEEREVGSAKVFTAFVTSNITNICTKFRHLPAATDFSPRPPLPPPAPITLSHRYRLLRPVSISAGHSAVAPSLLWFVRYVSA